MPVPALTLPYGSARGVQEPLSVPDPAAATVARYVVDGRGLRRLNTLVFTLTTDGTAGNRYVTVEYEDSSGRPYCVNAAAVVVLKSTTQRFAGSISRGEAEWAAGTDVLFPLDSVFLYPSDVLTIEVANVQAGDQLSGIRGTLERFPLDWNDLPTVID